MLELFKRLLPPTTLCATEVTYTPKGGTPKTRIIPDGKAGQFGSYYVKDNTAGGAEVTDTVWGDSQTVAVDDSRTMEVNESEITVKPLGATVTE